MGKQWLAEAVGQRNKPITPKGAPGRLKREKDGEVEEPVCRGGRRGRGNAALYRGRQGQPGRRLHATSWPGAVCPLACHALCPNRPAQTVHAAQQVNAAA